MIQAIKDAASRSSAASSRSTSPVSVLADGERIAPRRSIAATGYRCGLEPVVGHLGVLDGAAPRPPTGDAAAPGLRFVGYVPRPAPVA